MAAYAAVTLLKYIIDQLQHHPFPPITLDEQQVKSLTEIVAFLQEFLEGYNSPVAYSDEVDPLESRITDAVYAAEDVIEFQIVDRIQSRSPNVGKKIKFSKLFGGICKSSTTQDNLHVDIQQQQKRNSEDAIVFEIVDRIQSQSTNLGKKIRFNELFRGLCKSRATDDNLYQDLQQVIEEMNLIKKEETKTGVQAQMQRKVSTNAGSFTSSSFAKHNMMVGFDEVLDKLTGGQLNHRIIPIMGMGGIGKTTLARNIFENALVKDYFDICAWTTISQAYNVRETLRDVLSQAGGDSSDLIENELGQKLYKYLSGRRYLIIMDDIWNIEVWEKINFSFLTAIMGVE